MDQSGQRRSQAERNRQFIIKSHRKWWREAIVVLSSLLVWLYCLSVVYFFADALLGLNHRIPRLLRIIFKMTSEDVRSFSLLVVILFISIFVLLYLWSFYNKKRFGSLERRRYPDPAVREDMLGLDMIEESIYEELQDTKEITFEMNPVKRKAK